MTEHIGIAGYCRISVDEELDRDNVSIENQKAIITDFVKHRFPDSTLTFYEDRDRSGYTFEQREGYQAMRHGLMDHRYDVLIVKDFSRFSRRNSRGLVELEDLRDAGVRIISIGDGIDFPNDDDWLKIQFQFLINEMPVTDTSKKVRNVIKRRQADGQWICAAPYGYRINKYKEFEIVPTEADIVRLIFNLYNNEGWGYKRISNHLTEQGIPTPRMSEQMRKEAEGEACKRIAKATWAIVTVQGILDNDFYIGTLRQGKYTRVKINGKEVKRNDGEHVVIENPHQAIIDYRTFATTRALREKRTRSHYRGIKKYDNFYSGYLVCGDCGAPMFSMSRNDLKPAYTCGTYHRRGLAGCTSHHIRVDKLDELLKKYVRISLGGVRDEAEIRGHRKTYIGAMPGRIVNGLRQAGVSNPLMLLDEIDKVSSDYKGDTSAALLEVLDSEQNCRFRDHYIEMPVDLSEVLFIATANEVSGIPKPLLDRMELIEVSSYTENEKFHIAKEHLVEKQKSKNGIKKEQLTITDGALKDIIRLYTREAGVRSLERTIGKLCRKAAREIFKDSEAAVKVTKTNLKTYLGNPKYSPEKKNDHAEVGIVRGLAWTSVGGVTLEVEVNVLPGKGELVLTGKLGDVMKESAQAALSYVRSISEGYGIDAEFYTKHDIHIHIPEGAVPKDGPSAGITMATAMLSAITDRAVRADVAMTGEITLRGRVLPIGGLKEKLLAAKVIGIKTVCIPKDNEKDLEEISKEITDGMEIVPVEKFSQVEKIVFVK